MSATLLTGATGFIGQRLAAALVARGERVRCLVRDVRRLGGLPAAIDPVVGDVTRPASLVAALEGVEVVYHLAGATVVCHPSEYRRANALGTCNLAEACARREKPPVVVYLSSLAAAGPALADRPRRESDPVAPVSRYGKSKLAGEQALRAVSDRVPATIVRGAATFGPGDPNHLRLFKAARLGLNGVPGSPLVRLSWIHVEDLVQALLLAASRGARVSPADPARGVYFAAMPDPPTMAEVGRWAGEAVGNANVRTVGMPRWFIRFWGHVIDTWVTFTRNPRLLTVDKMREILAGSWTCGTEKARDELGFTCAVGMRDGFARTVAWYRARGLL